jgi:hypothetical protein
MNSSSVTTGVSGASQKKNSNINMSAKSKKKLAALDYKEAKSKWTKAKAKYELIKLIEEKKVQTKQKKNSTMIEVTLNGEKYLFNVLKPLSDKFSKAIFDKLHENMQVNMSSYKRKKFEEQRKDKIMLYTLCGFLMLSQVQNG